MARVESRHRVREWVVAGAADLLDAESVRLEQLRETAEGEHAEMLPRLSVLPLLRPVQRKRVPEPMRAFVTFVRENGCQPKRSEATLCQLARFSVDVTAKPPGRSTR